MILLCGIPSEEPLARVAAAAARLGIEFAFLNQRLAAHVELVLGFDGERVRGALGLGGDALPLERPSGIYVRIMDPEELPEHAPRRGSAIANELARRSGLFHAALTDWFEVAECRVLNRPSSMATNLSKPYQAQRIARCGFEIPATLVTSDPEAARAFRAEHGRVIYKSTSAARSIVRELDDASAGDLERVRDLPTQFQAYVPGDDVRVHVVGERVFATRIRCSGTDYRYAAREGAPPELETFELPGEVEARCRALSRELDLALCGIDLRCTPEGAWTCFEANPSPAYTYYEDHTGQPIAEAIALHLAGS